MDIRKIIGKVSWNLRFLDPMYIFFLLFFKVKKFTQKEQDEILKGIYDLRVHDPFLENLQKDWMIRLAILSLMLLVGIIISIHSVLTK